MIALYVLGAILIVTLGAVILAPLFEETPDERRLEDLPPEARERRAREALEDVEFEHETGKLPEDEYRRLRAHYGRLLLATRDDLAAVREEREGSDAPEERTTAPEEARRGSPGACPECGTATEPGNRYCRACGTALDRERSPPEEGRAGRGADPGERGT